MRTFAVGFRIHRYGLDAEAATGADNACCDFAAVGNEDLGDRMEHSAANLIGNLHPAASPVLPQLQILHSLTQACATYEHNRKNSLAAFDRTDPAIAVVCL